MQSQQKIKINISKPVENTKVLEKELEPTLVAAKVMGYRIECTDKSMIFIKDNKAAFEIGLGSTFYTLYNYTENRNKITTSISSIKQMLEESL